MANWVTLPNGVHIDLDDPHNPVTGDGSFSDLGKGGSKGGEKPTTMRIADSVSKDYILKKAAVHGISAKDIGIEPVGNELRVTISNSSKLSGLVDELDEDGVLMAYPKINSKAKSTPKEDGEFYEWYNSLSKEDRAFIDRSMGADKEEGAKYEKGLPDTSKMSKAEKNARARELAKNYEPEEMWDMEDQINATGKGYTSNRSIAEMYNLNANPYNKFKVTETEPGRYKIENVNKKGKK